MSKVLAFAGSNSKKSINKKLATYAASLLENNNAEVLDLNDYELPIYSIDTEQEEGIPENARYFLDKIKDADGVILSLAEHNGAYSTAFKNIFDWMSRIDGKLWNETPMLLMAASPGGRGGRSVLDIAQNRFPYMGGNIVAEFSLPNFGQNFEDQSISNGELDQALHQAVNSFENAIQNTSNHE